MQEITEHFRQNGWVVIDLLNPNVVHEVREQLEHHLQQLTGHKIPLEQYHRIAEEDSWHTQIQVQMTAFFRKEKFARKILSWQTESFRQLVGLDLLIQLSPYLRMTRPGKPQDNVGYHRDTFYGGSPYELSVIIPFVDCDEKMTLKVMSGSHLFSESLFPVTQLKSDDVMKGSEKHKLGFLYAPKLMDPEIESKMIAVPLRVGQILTFSLATVHGTRFNNSTTTRWSTDVRVVNSLAPVDFSQRPDYYEALCSSVVTESAKQYYDANAR